MVAARWAAYKVALRVRERQITAAKAHIAAAQAAQRQAAVAAVAQQAAPTGAAAPAVRVVALPPLTITRTS